MEVALLGAWLMWLPIDLVIVAGIVLFAKADKKYQAEKAAGLHQQVGTNPLPLE